MLVEPWHLDEKLIRWPNDDSRDLEIGLQGTAATYVVELDSAANPPAAELVLPIATHPHHFVIESQRCSLRRRALTSLLVVATAAASNVSADPHARPKATATIRGKL